LHSGDDASAGRLASGQGQGVQQDILDSLKGPSLNLLPDQSFEFRLVDFDIQVLRESYLRV
jgi:hypothetical protein